MTVTNSWMRTFSGGLPATEGLHLIERYRRVDLGHMEVEITVDDPVVLEQPWTVKHFLRLRPELDLEEEVCAENDKDVEHMVGK